MITYVKVAITEKDRNVGAMIKALAMGVTGFKAVSGTTGEFLQQNGHYIFHFPHADKAEEFRRIVRKYIPEALAQILE